MFNNVYQNKVVLVTGDTGFKGSWLSIWLRELGARVIGYSIDPPSKPSNFDVSRLQEKYLHIHNDVRDYESLLSAFSVNKPEFVFHLAAQPLVRVSYEVPKLTFDTNVGGTVNILEAIRQTSSVKVIVNITSDKCYENQEWIWGYRENDPMGGHDPYSASKGCAELVFHAFLNSFFAQKTGRQIGAASARAGNVVGGGDWGMDRLIPDCIRSLNSHQIINVRNPNAIRPWQHVLEPLSGYLWLGSRLWDNPQDYSGAWNFGPDDSSHMTVAEIVNKVIHLWGDGTCEHLSNPNAPHEAKLLKLSCDKAHAKLKWFGVLNIDECLRMTTEWYKKYYGNIQKNDMYGFCVDHINTYSKHASLKGLDWIF